MKILVLGGTRFFGKNLVERLLEQKHEVTIVTRGKSGNPFGAQVEHLLVDRQDEPAFVQLLQNRSFDIAYDNICYSPKEAMALCELLDGRVKKLVFTSTMSTYEADGVGKAEEDYNPYEYPITERGTTDISYGEGKRQAEAVFYKFAQFPVVAVRFPIIMGVDDYTKRLHFHVERVMNEEPIGFANMEAEMSFIMADEAAEFLYWVGMNTIEGPINATANGKISMKDLMKQIEQHTRKRAKIVLLGTEEIRSPYAIPASWYMFNTKAVQAGFEFTDLQSWLPQLIEDLIKTYED